MKKKDHHKLYLIDIRTIGPMERVPVLIVERTQKLGTIEVRLDCVFVCLFVLTGLIKL